MKSFFLFLGASLAATVQIAGDSTVTVNDASGHHCKTDAVDPKRNVKESVGRCGEQACKIIKVFSMDKSNRLDAIVVITPDGAHRHHPNVYHESPDDLQTRINAEDHLREHPDALQKKQNETPEEAAQRRALEFALKSPQEKEAYLREHPEMAPNSRFEARDNKGAREALKHAHLSPEQLADLKARTAGQDPTQPFNPNPGDLTVAEIESLEASSLGLSPLDFDPARTEKSGVASSYKFRVNFRGNILKYDCKMINERGRQNKQRRKLRRSLGDAIIRRIEYDQENQKHFFLCFLVYSKPAQKKM